MSKMKYSKPSTKQQYAGNVLWNLCKWFFYIFMVFSALTFVYAFIWVLINSFKTGIDYTQDVFRLPQIVDIDNYKQVLENLEYKGYSIWGMLGNSLKLILITVIITVTFPQMAAYVLARFDFRGKRLIETAVYASLMIPVVGNLATQLNFLINAHLYNKFLGVFLLQASGLGFSQIILTSFYKGIDKAYAEAAYIDGASEWKVFLWIYYPQSVPLLMINLINGIIGAWNDYMTGYMFLPDHPTIALGLQQMQTTFVSFGNDYPVMFAGIILTMIPIIIIFIFFGPKIMNTKDLGALK